MGCRNVKLFLSGHLARTSEGLLLAALALVLVFVGSHRGQGPHYPDEVDYWQLAGNLRQGKGFVTRLIRPLEVTIHPDELFADMSRPPFFPMAVAAQREILSDSWLSWNPVGKLPLVLLAVSQWWLATMLAGKWAGRVAWALVMANSSLAFYSDFLLTEILFCLLTTLFLLVLLNADKSVAAAIMVGLVLAGSFLTRAVAVLYLPAVFLFLWFVPRDRRRRIAVLLAASAVLPIIPWLVRNWQIFGRPLLGFNSLQLPMFTETWPGYSLFRTLEEVDILSFVLSHPEEIVQKWWRGFTVGVRGLANQAGFAVLALWFLSPFVTKRTRDLRIWLLGALTTLCFLIALPLYEPRARHFLPLVVWFIPVAASLWAGLLISSPSRRILGFLLALIFFWQQLEVRTSLPEPRPLTCETEAAKALNSLAPGTIVASDAPWLVVMASNHRSIWIPQDLHAWRECRAAMSELTAVYLTKGLLDWSEAQKPKLWEEFLESGAPIENLVDVRSFPDGSRLWTISASGRKG